MEKINKYSNINLISVIIIFISKFSQSYLIEQNTHIGRKVSLYFGLFLTIPALIVALIYFILIIKKYNENKKLSELKRNYKLFPFIITFLFLIVVVVLAFINSW